MTCTDMEVRIPELLAGETPADDRPAVEQHLMDCAGCREKFNLARLAWDAAARWHAPAPPAPLVQRTALAVRLGAAATPFQKRLLTFLRLGTAAAAAVFLALAATSMGPSTPAPRGETARGRAPRAPDRSGPVLAAVSPSVGQLFVRDPETGKPAGELEIRRIHARVTIADGIARTEIEQIFHNKADRQLEGTFFFPLPPDASIARLALEVEGKLVEGVVEERQKARQVYESIVRRMQDPALLEWQPGGVFKCRIFPIPARGERRIILGYEQALSVFDARYRYIYPLAGESTREKGIGVFTFEATVRESSRLVRVSTPSHDLARVVRPSDREAVCRFSDEAFKPDKDFVLDVEVEPAGELAVTAHRPEGSELGWFAAFVAPAADAVEAVRGPKHVVFLVDASASVGTAQMDVARRLIGKMAAGLGPADRYLVASHNVEVRTMGDYVAGGATGTREVEEFLYAIRPAGACDLERALRQLLPGLPEGAELVYIGEGTPTLGESEPAKLAAIAREVRGGKSVTIRTVAVGSMADRPLLETLAREFNGGAHAVSPSDDVTSRVAEIARTLGRSAMNDLKVEFEGPVGDVAPGKLGAIHFGERLVVTGRYRPGAAKMILTGKVHGREIRRVFPIALPEREAGNANAKRLWAQRKLADLARQGESKKDEAVALSKEHQVMCPWTSFLVLESEEAYKQYEMALKKVHEDLRKTETLKDLSKALKEERAKGKRGEGKGDDGDGRSPGKPEADRAPSERPLGETARGGVERPPSAPAPGADPGRAPQPAPEPAPVPAPRAAARAPAPSENGPQGQRDGETRREEADELRRRPEAGQSLSDHNETLDEEEMSGERTRRSLDRLSDRGVEDAIRKLQDFQGPDVDLDEFVRRKSPETLQAGKFRESLERTANLPHSGYSLQNAAPAKLRPKEEAPNFNLEDASRNRRIETLQRLSGGRWGATDKKAEGGGSGAKGADLGGAADAAPFSSELVNLRGLLSQAVGALGPRPDPATEAYLEFEGQVHFGAGDLPRRLEAFLAEAARRRDALTAIAGSEAARRAYEDTLRLFGPVMIQARIYAERQLAIVKGLDRARVPQAMQDLDAEWGRLVAAYREASFDRVGEVASTADPRRQAAIVTRLDALVVPGDVLVVTRQGAFVAVLRVDAVDGRRATARVYADLWVRDLQPDDRLTRVATDTELWNSLPEAVREDILSKNRLERVRATMRALREMKSENPQ